MTERLDLFISSLRFADCPEVRTNPFTQEKLTVFSPLVFSADERQTLKRIFTEAGAKGSDEEHWIDITLGAWKAHVESNLDMTHVGRVECSGLPNSAAIDLIFAILTEANAYIQIEMNQAGPHELRSIGAKARLPNYRRVSSPEELADWIKSELE